MDENLGMVPPNTTGTYQQVAALFAALAEAQADFAPVVKNQTAKIKPRDTAKMAYEFKYADLSEVIAATRPALAKNGLAVVQPLVRTGEFLAIRTILMHAGGATMWTECEAPSRDVSDLKEFGGQYNYLRRYLMQGLLAVASEDDLDASGDEGGGGHSGGADGDQRGDGGDGRPEPMRATTQRGTTAIDAGCVTWINRKIKSLGLTPDLVTAMLKRLSIPEKPWAELSTDDYAKLRPELVKAAALPGS